MKILMVEDEVLIGMMMERQMKDIGLAVWKRVGTGEEAVRLMEGEGADLILMDIRLAGKMSGIEAARLIKANRPDIPVIFMTAYGTPEVKTQAMAIHPLGFLEKPVAMGKLSELIGPILAALQK